MLTDMLFLEWLGYGASVLVLISLTMSSLERLRWFSLAGSVCFAGYAWKIDAPPVLAVNIAIAAVNVFYLSRMYARKDYFKTINTPSRTEYLSAFFDYHGDDIRRWYPDFSGQLDEECVVFLTLRNMAVAGVFAVKDTHGSTWSIKVDYVVPRFADHKVGRHLFAHCRDLFLDNGIRRLTVDRKSIRNERYFLKMGFRPISGSGTDQLEMDVGQS